MISQLSGTIVDITENIIILDVSGVGYEVSCSRFCLAELSLQQDVQIIVHMDVKEDSIRLYGFQDRLEKRVFHLLVGVKGVGARSALDILSRIEKRELLRLIGSGDASQLQKIKGIGKKTAERIIVELKDKVAGSVAEGVQSALAAGVEKEVTNPLGDAIAALESLGFSRRDAEHAVQQAEQSSEYKGRDAGEIVKLALQFV